MGLGGGSVLLFIAIPVIEKLIETIAKLGKRSSLEDQCKESFKELFRI